MKVVETEYGTPREILKFLSHHVGVAAMIDDTGITADSKGRKIIPAGTLVKGLGTGTVEKANDSTTEGLILSEVNVTHGKAPCTVIIHGFINTAKLPEAPSTAAKTALRQISFM